MKSTYRLLKIATKVSTACPAHLGTLFRLCSFGERLHIRAEDDLSDEKILIYVQQIEAEPKIVVFKVSNY